MILPLPILTSCTISVISTPSPSPLGYLQKIGPSLCFEAVITIFANSASSLGAITTTFGKQQRYAKSKDPA